MKKNNVPQGLTRTNNKIITSLFEPLFTASNTAAQACYKGVLYSASAEPVILKSSGFIGLQISNPASSSKTLYFNDVFFGVVITTDATANIDVDILRGATLSAGTALTARNLNFGLSDNSVTSGNHYVDNVTTDPTSGGVLVLTKQTQVTSVQVQFPLEGQIIVPPGKTFTVRVSNASIGSASVASSMSVTWWEY